jgi:FKBP-type peptidyl-prolyl cis-trans isomerase FkpA
MLATGFFAMSFPPLSRLPLIPFRSVRRVLCIVAMAAASGTAVGQAPAAAPAVGSSQSSTTFSKFGAKVTELQIVDEKQGTGAEAVAGKAVIVHYTGWLYDPGAADGHGAKFDSSRDRGVPFGFILGMGKVIKGWDEGVAGMKVGGRRTLVIPPDKAYGERGAGGVIPPGATLLFDVELIDIRS